MNKTTLHTIALALLTLGLFSIPTGVLACCSVASTPSSTWMAGANAAPGKRNIQICLPANIFAAAAPTNCACGLGLKGTLPPSLNLTGAVVLNGAGVPVPTFSAFTPNAATGATLAAGGPFGTPPVAGATWFGFRGVSTPVTAQPGILCFIGDVNESELGMLAGLQVIAAAGEADNNFDPVPGPHFTYSSNGTSSVVPEPGATATAIAASFVGALFFLRRKRRSA